MWLSIQLFLLVSAASQAMTPAGPAPNTLTPEEMREGWILLWDGTSTFGWEPMVRSDWKAPEGELSMASGSYVWMRNRTPFADFVLKADFRIKNADADSGIFIRAAREGDPSRTGYQVNINNVNAEWGTGSLVFRVKADPGIGKVSINAWHSYEITAEGDHITAYLDGRKAIDAHDASARIGYMGLQFLKPEEVEFRNVKLRPLGLQPLFNGKDLTGWEKVDRPNVQAPPVWSVRDGAIHVEKGPGQLETASVYSDFLLQLEVRTNAQSEKHHPNSGVFWRGDRGGFWTGYESQIRNEYKGEDRSQPVDFGTGGIYNQQAARRVVSDDNEFFTKTVAVCGRHMATWVNGIQVTDYEDVREEGMDARKQARLAAGPISLQAHDPTTNLDFRDIRISPLPQR
jgi:hypothetical protein